MLTFKRDLYPRILELGGQKKKISTSHTGAPGKLRQINKLESHICFYDEYSRKGLCHYLKTCRKYFENEKAGLQAEYMKGKNFGAFKRINLNGLSGPTEKDPRLSIRKISEIIKDETKRCISIQCFQLQ